jgi:hypothetical protein
MNLSKYLEVELQLFRLNYIERNGHQPQASFITYFEFGLAIGFVVLQ